VRGGIGRHLLESPAGAALTVGPAGRGCASAVKTLDQVVADLLQLGHVGHVSLGAEEGMRRLAGLPRVGGIRGELRLEVGDLPAKLLAPEPLIGLDGRHLGLSGPYGQIGAGGVDGPREIPGIDAVVPGALHSIGREPLQVGRAGSVLGHERPEAMARGDQAVILEPSVDRTRGVDVDAGAAGELADAGEPVAGAELAACDQHPQPPCELRAERQIVGSRQIRRQIRGLLRTCIGGLCHCTSTLALIPPRRQDKALLAPGTRW
jgi:hypothetical protein